MRDKQGRLEWHPDRVSERVEQRFSRLPTPPMEAVLRSRKAALADFKPEPRVIDRGLQDGDTLVFSWIGPDELSLKGCQLAVLRGNITLNWMTGGFARDPHGKWIYLPYVRSSQQMKELVVALTTASGYTMEVIKEQGYFLHLRLLTAIGESRRVISGDKFSFCPEEKSVSVSRIQGTLDMNLYRPEGGPTARVIFETQLPWLSPSPNYFPAFARILAEVNGLQCAPSNGGFRATK